ncbi:hypothetical protein F2P56_012267 [Juglans regia]|uniref:Uncharacterized protein n=1 Tax=Juglans regia TaxID=51240 RepID=A0A833XIL1_JUGRE|nr:hypothetical protein F2P56_012267 [Juglans regia]
MGTACGGYRPFIPAPLTGNFMNSAYGVPTHPFPQGIDIYKQPAFDHPALRNHTIQMRPSFTIQDETSSTKGDSSPAPALSQTWQKSGSCPEGTVPIRRIRKQDLSTRNYLVVQNLDVLHLDGYEKTGCINLVCPGFVQTSKTILLGGILQPLSQKNGPQYQIDLTIKILSLAFA